MIMKNKILKKENKNKIKVFQKSRVENNIINTSWNIIGKRYIKQSQNYINIIVKNTMFLIVFLSLWVQVPQWENDWSKCAVDIPDSSCHWYVKSPDNTYGKGFDWKNAPWFDVNGLNDIAETGKETVVEKLQKQ